MGAIMINWQDVLLNLQNQYKALETVAKEVGASGPVLRQIARGETKEPKFSVGVKLLDLHFEHCSPRHTPEKVLK